MVSIMAHYGIVVEYGLHCLLWLVGERDKPVSSRDLADLQGVPAPFVAKIFPQLEKAGIVAASKGIQGGYRLARPAAQVSVLDVVDAIEGRKRLFDCQEIRGRCALFRRKKPPWSGAGVCGIHAVMLRAERSMRSELAKVSLLDLASGVQRKAPASFAGQVSDWLNDRAIARNDARLAGMGIRPTKSRRGRKA
jgi:Rrf2 family protein